MEKSIENIWKESFEANTKLSAPNISNLYKRKSKLVIQQINSKTKWDNLSLIPVALIIFGVLVFMGKMLLGAYAAILILALFFVNRKMLKDLELLDIKDNTYTYLLNYQSRVKNIIKSTTWLIGLGLPLVIIPAYYIFFQDTNLLSKHNTLSLEVGIMTVVILSLVISVISILSYRLTTQVVYGRLLEKLESTLKDMEELMN